MADILISKLSETFLKVSTSDDIKNELYDHFSFYADGYKFHPKFKAKLWDGILHMFNRQRGTIYYGLKFDVMNFAKENGYSVEWDEEDTVKIIDKDKFIAWADALNVHDGDKKPIKIREYQYAAAIEAIESKRIVALAPTSSGKSLIIYLLVRWFERYDKSKMLLVVPSVNLVQQMFNDFKDYSFANGWDVDAAAQEIYAESKSSLRDKNKNIKDIDKKLTISTWQSIYNIDPKTNFFKQFNVIFGDEAHLFAATSLVKVLESATNAKYRIGTTGTLDGKKVNKMTLVGLFGKVHVVSTLKELMDNNHISKLKTNVIVLNHEESIRKVVVRYDYQAEMDYISASDKRNKFICKLAISTKGNTLIMVNFIDKHLKPMVEMLEGMVGDTRKIIPIYGSVSVEDVKAVIKQESNCIIVASYKKFSTGANVPSIKNIILAAPYKSIIRVLQTIGRGLRLFKGKDYLRLFDIIDNFTYKDKQNTTFIHGTERLKIYNDEKFNYKISEYDL